MPRLISACVNWAASLPVPKEARTTTYSDRQSVGYLLFRYQNDRFYDPIRKEHRAVQFWIL